MHKFSRREDRNLEQQNISTVDLDDRYLTEKQASEITGYSCSWFQRARWNGTGPEYTKTGNTVRYKRSKLFAWMDSHTISSTSKNA